ncbi:energy-coupling factor ABC transporter ATP-binding protein [Oxalobacteraceae bacterium R-40]|uniref:Energy-coupling factor ABC transporter ATP-binding protein n=1 Tax=Keguizhuia sedimenti TaxID=3064264 RepID=A0ABU1BJI4_9BURK|nr:energy-coupling factor ABC transporter ATP-binding protein [Oxalobacteraceae bacterium R-40]
MSSLLNLHSLEKRFGDRVLFRIETLTLDRGKAYVLTGSNGSGKSTLLKILGGLERARVEQAFFLGHAVRFFPYPREMRRSVVYVHQHPVMFDTSIEANIGYGLAARGFTKGEIRERVEEAMRWAGLIGVRNLPPRTLSGGEKQRVALARAKVVEPKLLLLDEPTANLDTAAREQVMQLLPQLTSMGTSVVIACHDRELIRLSDALRLDLREGRLCAHAEDAE